MTFAYPPESLAAFPPSLHPDYKSTVKRAPKRPLVVMPHTLSELTGPVYGHDGVRPGDDDLTRQHAGEPLGERIIVHGRVRIAAGGIGLPDLDHGVAERFAVAVEHAAFDADGFPGRVRRHQIVADGGRPIVIAGRERDGEIRPDRLGWSDAGHVRAGPASGCGRAARCRTRRRAPNPAPWRRDRSARSSARAPSRPRPS